MAIRRSTGPASYRRYDPAPMLRADGSRPTAAERGHARSVLNRLKRRYPKIGTALEYRNPWQLLVSTVLSAQTTDDNVNRVATVLFGRYPQPADLAAADPEEVEKVVFSTGFYRQKTKAIQAVAVELVQRFGGEVPRTLEELVTLRGVGRKTASVVLAEAFDSAAVAVDTHVRRVSGRLGLTTNIDPAKIETDIKAVFPRDEWSKLSMRLIQFGRDVCQARRPRCPECEMAPICPWPGKRV